VALKPGSGGIFEVSASDSLIWSRKAQRRFAGRGSGQGLSP